jgi:two-component system response regulator NreC
VIFLTGESRMQDKYRIVLVEDHTILREGLRSLLREHENLEVVGEAGDGRTAVRLVLSLKPDLVLMDLSMPKMNGFEAILEIKKVETAIKIIALTVHNTEEYILMTLQAGADGYVLKDATHDELIMAIRQVLSGKRFLSPSVSGKVIEGYLEGKKNIQSRSQIDSLTQREREVLKLIAEGYKNKEVADLLCISLKTVEKHRANLMRKLDLHNTSSLTLYAVERGLVNR